MAILKDTIVNGTISLQASSGSGNAIDDVQLLLNNVKSMLMDTGWVSCASAAVEANANSYVFYRVKNGICFIHGSANNGVTINGTGKSQVNLGTIPAIYKPTKQIYCIGSPQKTDGYDLQVTVEVASGNITACILHTTNTTNYWKFDFCYPIERTL